MILPKEHDKIEFNSQTDLSSTQCTCPSCGDKYLFGVPYINVPCKKCGITFRTSFNQDIYAKKAKQIISKLAYHDKLTLSAREKYESDLITVRHHFIEMLCWDVSEINQTNEEYKSCELCGVCMDCFSCNRCKKQFVPDKNRRKQKCPECHSSEFSKTYFKSIKMVNKDQVDKKCPFCNSTNVRMTRTQNKNKCHLCGGTELSHAKTNNVFTFTIERKNAYRRP